MDNLATNTNNNTNNEPAADPAEVRNEVRALLKRSGLDVMKTIQGEKSGEEGDHRSYEGKLFTFQVRGDQVETPFKRYYLNRKLENLCTRFGVEARTRRLRKAVEGEERSVFIDVYPLDEEAQGAEKTMHGTRRRIAPKGQGKKAQAAA